MLIYENRTPHMTLSNLKCREHHMYPSRELKRSWKWMNLQYMNRSCCCALLAHLLLWLGLQVIAATESVTDFMCKQILQ